MNSSISDPIRPLLAILVIMLWGGAACATGGSSTQSNNEEDSSPAERPTSVQVDNGNNLDMVVYALADGQYRRLGNVTAHQRSDLTLPRYIVSASDVRLVADPIGSQTAYLSERILFSPGDILVLNIGARMNLSSVSVRSRGP